ncbi:MAG: universal stress protein [Pseudomonadota bacterium]
MAKILACIDGSIYSKSVAEHTAWAAGRLGASVEIVQVLGRRTVSSDDRSGRIVAGGRRRLLEKLAEIDGERAKVMQEKAWLDLDEAREDIVAAGVSDVATALRQGDLLDTLSEREGEADLVVLGKRGEAADFATMHLGSNLERILRASTKPVLVAARAFKPISRVMFAVDGRSGAARAIDAAARSPLFSGLDALVVTVSREAGAEAKLEAAAKQLEAGGLTATTRQMDGEPAEVIPALVEAEEIDLLVMGAYGHSRLRTMVIGSTTSEVVRSCLIPIFVWR